MDKYQIIQTIDSGSYGVVYKAKIRSTGELVAVKIFKDTSTPEYCQVIRREIRMLKKLQSEFVVKLLDVQNFKGKTCLIFQHMPQNLLKFIEENKNINQLKALFVLRALLRAVQFIHKQGCIHRDIKPQNILLQNNTLKLCDFGFCRERESEMSDYVATRWYRAPELLIGQDYSYGIDIWAIGCIFFQMVKDQPLFPGASDIETLRLIQSTLGPITKKQKFYLQIKKNINNFAVPETLAFQAKCGKSFSQKSLTLLRRLLDVNPDSRISASDAIQSQAFQVLKPSRRKSVSISQLSRLKGSSKSEYKSIKLPLLKIKPVMISSRYSKINMLS